jgi:hypothetical protein
MKDYPAITSANAELFLDVPQSRVQHAFHSFQTRLQFSTLGLYQRDEVLVHGFDPAIGVA